MSGYLQRLLDAALPASEPPALAPVVKSASPIFEQNQLLGLPGFEAGEPDVELTPPVSEASRPQDPNAPARLGAAMAHPPLEITRHGLRPVMPAPSPDAEIGRSFAAGPLAWRPTAADPITPPRHGPLGRALEPAPFAPQIIEPAPLFEAAPPEESESGGADFPPTVLKEVAFAPLRIETVTREAIPPARAEAMSEPDTDGGLGAPQIVTTDVPHALEPIERAPETPPPPSVLEPRARRDFGDRVPEADQPQPEPPQAPPRITIGRVTVELLPDQAPAAKPARDPRSAAAASMIGPLGNRRVRRRLFALSHF